jgi:hypothetical protein
MVYRILSKLSTFEELELRERLGKSLDRNVSDTQWDFVKAQGVVENYVISPLAEEREKWEEFTRDVNEELERLQRWYEGLRKEEDEDYQGSDSPLLQDQERSSGHVRKARGSERTAARTEALRAYDRLQAGTDTVPDRPAMYAALFPWGGLDSTVAQWVYALQVELWVPVEEVKADYLAVQQALTEESTRKASPRTLEVARFVWEQRRRVGGKDLSYLDLMERWNKSRSDGGKFSDWRAFYTAFVRGKEAALPRYERSAGLLQQGVREGYGKDLFGTWASEVRAMF